MKSEVLKNSCPVCGYFTLGERAAFDICEICFWEDDGIDDIKGNRESGPNQMTLIEGRKIFQEAKRKLLSINDFDSNLMVDLRNKFLILDSLIEQKTRDKTEVLNRQSEIIDFLRKNKVYGLDKLFEK